MRKVTVKLQASCAKKSNIMTLNQNRFKVKRYCLMTMDLRKHIFFSKSRSNDDGLYSNDLYKRVTEDLKLVVPLYHLLNKMI